MSTGGEEGRISWQAKDAEIVSEQRAREAIAKRIADDALRGGGIVEAGEEEAGEESSIKEHTGADLSAGISNVLVPDEEPTIEQLRATGEYVEEGDGEGEEGEEDIGSEGEEGDKRPASTSMTRREPAGELTILDKKNEEKSIRAQVREGLLNGESQDELIGRGFNKRTVQTVASDVKKELRTRTSVGKAPMTAKSGLPIFAKGSPPEAIIESLDISDLSLGGGGEGETFGKGMKFGMSLSVFGIRMAQELSAMGIVQAKPIIDMAKSMREGEVLAAKTAAGEAAMEAANMVLEGLAPGLRDLAKSSKANNAPVYAASKNPMQDMMMQTMMPIMQKLLGGALGGLGGLGGGAAIPLPAPVATQLPAGATPSNVSGWSRISE